MAVAAFAEETTLAVLDFQNNSFFNAEEVQPLSKGLAEMMITEIGKVQSIRVVERSKLRTIMDELKLSQSGVISEQSSVEVGRMVGAQHLVFGSYMVMPSDKVRIDMRIVQVETGLTMKAGEVTGKTKQMLDLINRLSKKILEDLDIRLTKQDKQALEESKALNIKAVVHFSQGVEFEDAGKTSQAVSSYRKALKIEPGFEQAKKRLNALETSGKN